jgi:hypothetical protein
MVSALRKIETLRRLTARERRLALTAIGLVALTRGALWLIPFRWIQRALEQRAPERAQEFRDRARTARDVVWAIRLASRYVPRATCLTQALAAQVLLARSGIESRIVVGVSNRESFQAHAWVESNGSILLGRTRDVERYAPILTLTGAPKKNAL